MELTHLATLYHDDVMDEALLRRGAPSANARWDNTVAILTGDFLFARASEILADLGPEAVRIQAQTFERLVTGQIHETVGPTEGADPLEHYLRVVARQDRLADRDLGPLRRDALGAPTQARPRCSRSSASASGWPSSCPTTSSTSLSDSTESGKTPGTDLREGVPTLPVLHVQRALADPRTPGCSSCSSGPLPDDDRHAEALGLVAGSPGDGAGPGRPAAVGRRGPSPARPAARRPGEAALASLCDVVVDRTG